jgi:hypothetical protein
MISASWEGHCKSIRQRILSKITLERKSIMPNNTIDQPNSNDTIHQSNPAFWTFHPIGRGIGAGVATQLLSEATPFSTGFIFGALSGGINAAIRPHVKLHLEKSSIPAEHKALAYLAATATPWAASAGIMHLMHKATANSFFKIKPGVAAVTAIAVECFGYANKDLLKRAPSQNK